jgi:hypothetical protein
MLPAASTAETLRTENADSTLTVAVSFPTANILRLHYEFVNTGALPIFLFNQLWDTVGTDPATGQSVFRVLPNLANVAVNADAVTVSKAVVDVPYGLLVETWHLPCLAQVAPGARHAETVELQYPLRPYTPYEPEVELGAVVSRALHFELGYLMGNDATVHTLRPVATATGPAFYLHGLPAKDQRMLTTGPFQASVLVNSPLYPRPPKPTSNGKWTPWG